MTVTWDFHWAQPDPEVVAHRLIRLAHELEELVEPLTVAGEITRLDIKENFATGTGPDGMPWKSWSDSYEPYALANTTGPIFGNSANLHLSGAMEDAATSRSAFFATNQGLFFDASGLPEYWAWNNFGAQRVNAGGGSTAAERKADYASFRAENDLLDEFGSLAGENVLPARPFVGLSDEAQNKIDAAFYAWFEGEVTAATSPLGKPFFRHSFRGPSGRFAKV